MNYIAYYRVSTTKQGQSGLGLEAQQHTVSEFLHSVSGELIDSFTEVASGRKDERKQLIAALRKCKLTGSTLVIAKLDRLSRNRSFLMALEESAVNFICCDMPEANRLTIGLMACIADYEAQLISERTKAALQAAKRRGAKLGNPNLAEVRNTDTTAATKKLQDNANKYATDVFEIITAIEADHGELSTRKVAGHLNEAGYKTSRNKPFSAMAVSRIKARMAA